MQTKSIHSDRSVRVVESKQTSIAKRARVEMHRDVSHAGDDEHGKSPAVWTVGALALLLILPIGSPRPRQKTPKKAVVWSIIESTVMRASISRPLINSYADSISTIDSRQPHSTRRRTLCSGRRWLLNRFFEFKR